MKQGVSLTMDCAKPAKVLSLLLTGVKAVVEKSND